MPVVPSPTLFQGVGATSPRCNVRALSPGAEGSSEIPVSEYPDRKPFDPARIDVQTRTPTVGQLLERLRRGVLELAPGAGLDSDVDQSRLIESLLLRIPLPPLYAAESGEDAWTVVDGAERLMVIARFAEPCLIGTEPLRLSGLEYLRQCEGKGYGDLPPAMRTRLDETELVVHLVRASTPEPVKFNIFSRISVGRRPLSPRELREALDD